MSRFLRRRIAKASIAFNTAGGATTICEVPAGGVVLAVWAHVRTAFNAGTTNVVIVGHADDDDAYLAAADVSEGSAGISVAKGPFVPETAKRTVQVKYTQTGTAASTGAADAYVEYVS
jgi:hypothetical protein